MSKKTPQLPPIPGPDDGAPRQSKADRRAAAAALMREQKRRARRRALVVQTGVGALVVAAVVGITLVVLDRRGPGDDATPPAGVTADGAIRFGAEDAPLTLQAVEDFQCPVCQQFEEVNGDLLQGYREGDQVAVEYRPIAFLDRASSTEYSSRALNASACVLDEGGKDAWLTYHGLLFDNQPEEGTDGLPDSDLVDLAGEAGVSGEDVESCIEDRRFGDWVEQTTDAAFDGDVTGTPTLFLNGEKLDGFATETITQAVADAGGS